METDPYSLDENLDDYGKLMQLVSLILSMRLRRVLEKIKVTSENAEIYRVLRELRSYLEILRNNLEDLNLHPQLRGQDRASIALEGWPLYLRERSSHHERIMQYDGGEELVRDLQQLLQLVTQLTIAATDAPTIMQPENGTGDGQGPNSFQPDGGASPFVNPDLQTDSHGQIMTPATGSDSTGAQRQPNTNNHATMMGISRHQQEAMNEIDEMMCRLDINNYPHVAGMVRKMGRQGTDKETYVAIVTKPQAPENSSQPTTHGNERGWTVQSQKYGQSSEGSSAIEPDINFPFNEFIGNDGSHGPSKNQLAGEEFVQDIEAVEQLCGKLISGTATLALCGGNDEESSNSESFDQFVVIDLKGTFLGEETEVYREFSSVIVEAATGHLLEPTFHTYLRPRIMEYSSRNQELEYDGAVTLSQALQMHKAWLEKNGGGSNLSRAVVMWGDLDWRLMLEQECQFKGLPIPDYFCRWINLKKPFVARYGDHFWGSPLQDVLEATKELKWEGPPKGRCSHVHNMARLLAFLNREGAALTFTHELGELTKVVFLKHKEAMRTILRRLNELEEQRKEHKEAIRTILRRLNELEEQRKAICTVTHELLDGVSEAPCKDPAFSRFTKSPQAQSHHRRLAVDEDVAYH